MANTKISALTTGTPAVGTDEFPIARAGANNKLTLAQLVTLASTSPSFTGLAYLASGTATPPASPNIALSGFNNSIYGFAQGQQIFLVNVTKLALNSAQTLAWSASSTNNDGGADAGLIRASANSIRFGDGTSATTVSRTEINKLVTGISNNVATATFTVTIPNGAHSASLRVRLKGSLGAGGAVGANEASASIAYDVCFARTAGVNAVAAISTAYGSSGSAAVAGAATCTVTGAVSTVTGAVGAANTFTVNVTVARGSGTSDNHTCFAYGELINDNTSGVTIA